MIHTHVSNRRWLTVFVTFAFFCDGETGITLSTFRSFSGFPLLVGHTASDTPRIEMLVPYWQLKVFLTLSVTPSRYLRIPSGLLTSS